MSYLCRPTVEGVYRVKVQGQNRYLELVPGPDGRLKLVPREESSDQQLWKIVPHGDGTFKVTNEFNDRFLSFKRPSDSKYGYPVVGNDKIPTSYWSFIEGSVGFQKYSRISVSGDSSGHVFDSCEGHPSGLLIHFHPTKNDNLNQRFEFELGGSGFPPALDLIFLQDTTGSQQPYIQAAIDGIDRICQRVSSVGKWKKDGFRMGLVAFRDYPPQDYTYITKEYPFTSDIPTMEANLRGLSADGGGDGPEAQTAALDSALNANWTEDGAKIAILITDAPPHGIGDIGDGLPGGAPDHKDPIEIAHKMGRAAIALYVLACEPSLSSYHNALDFYRGLVSITGGAVVPLTHPERLADLVISQTLEAIQVENLISQYGDEIAFNSRRPDFSIHRAAAQLLDRLCKDGVSLQTVDMSGIYEESVQGDRNASMWAEASDIAEGRGKVVPISGGRMKPHYAGGAVPKLELRPPTLPQAERLVKQILKRNSRADS